MWNPPLIDEATGARRSPLSEAAELLADLVAQDVRTICFLRSRRGIELIQRFARDNLARARQAGAGGTDRALPRRLHAAAAARDRGAPGRRRAAGGRRHRRPRAGHRHRRARRGDLRHLPGHRRQPAGRCGGGRDAGAAGLAVYVAGQDALDQFFCRHPDEFLGRPVEAAILDHASEQIAAAHLVAAAYELPLTDDDEEVFGPGWRERADRLVAAGELRRAGGKLLPRRSGFVASRDPAAIRLGRRGRGDRARVGRDARTGRGRASVHDDPPRGGLPPSRPLLRGRALDIEARRAVVSGFEGDWFTRPKKETEIYIEGIARAP